MAEEAGSAPEAGNPAPEAAPAPVNAPAEQSSWADAVQDESLRGWVEAKGLHNAGIENVVKSYHNLEKLIGADKADRTVMLPGPDAEETELDAFYQRLGRPEKAEQYDLPVPEGDDGKMADWARGVFHKAGLSDKQAQAVASAWNEYVGGMQQEQVQVAQQSAQEAEASLRKEWGAAYDQKVRGIDHAAGKLGMTPEQLEGLRNSMGPVAAMKFVDGLAGKLGEDRMDFDGEAGTGALTPNAAMRELQKLGTDKEFMAAWMDKNHPSHKWAVEKKQNLARMAAGQAA